MNASVNEAVSNVSKGNDLSFGCSSRMHRLARASHKPAIDQRSDPRTLVETDLSIQQFMLRSQEAMCIVAYPIRC